MVISKTIRHWIERLEWLTGLIDPEPLLEGVTHTKLRQFASEAMLAQRRNVPSGQRKDVPFWAKPGVGTDAGGDTFHEQGGAGAGLCGAAVR